jgi:hypothetical protein
MSSAFGSSDPVDAALSTIVADALSDWDRVQGDAPDLLYHYTDVAGLIGICSSGSLWATNLRFMNDAKELAHSWKLMLKVLAEAKDKAGFPAQLELIEEIERTAVAGWVGYPDFYATSFTANGDLLSQWRGYGSSGGGYAIGFDAARLASPPSPYPQPDRFLNRVIYEEETQLRVLRATADKMLELFATADPNRHEMTGARARLFAALGEVVGFVFSFKDPAWAEEQEWRSVYVLPTNELDGVEFRPSGGIAVPYVTLAMGQGPGLDNETGVRAVELLLASTGYSDVEITISAVPLRP